MRKKLRISKSLNLSADKIALLSDFCEFCINKIPISGDVFIEVVSDRKSHNIETTAYYSIVEGRVCIYGKNRALVDVCRSIAHELTHMMQDETGLINGPVQNIGGFHENQANSKAGALIKSFAKSHPFGKMIYERKIV